MPTARQIYKHSSGVSRITSHGLLRFQNGLQNSVVARATRPGSAFKIAKTDKTGAFGSRGISKIPILKLNLKVKIVADGTKIDKTSGKHISMHSSASPGIPPELPAAHGTLPGDDETARLPLPVPVLSPRTASKRPVGALSPTDVALFPTSSCTDEGSFREAGQMPGTLSSGGCPDKNKK